MKDTADRRVAVVTGVSRGVGLGIAQHLSQSNFRVVGISRTTPPNNLDVVHIAADMTDSDSVVSAFHDIKEQFGRLDVLINNAAVLNSQYLMIMSTKSIEAMISTNLTGAIIAAREAMKIMRKNHYGRIINISSMATVLKPTGDSVYAATKSAIEMFSSITAKESFSMGITSNVLSVSAYDSEMFRSLNHERVQKVVDGLPVPGLVGIDDVTNIVDYLISPAGVSITGQIIRLGGIS
jgi:3-oxoacyl-[acyl-carrier protein] reductase